MMILMGFEECFFRASKVQSKLKAEALSLQPNNRLPIIVDGPPLLSRSNSPIRI